jgi:hypothetical protein
MMHLHVCGFVFAFIARHLALSMFRDIVLHAFSLIFLTKIEGM